MKVQVVNVDELDTNTVQPKSRTDERHLKRLAEILKKRGLLKPITVVRVAKKRLVVADGHRTLAAWRSLGFGTIACSISDVDSEIEAEAIFAELNSAARQMAGRAYLEQWANATDGDSQLAAMGRKATNIKRFIKIFGEKNARLYGKRGDVDPNVAARAELAARTIGVYTTPPPVSKIGHWMIKHKAMVKVLGVCNYGSPAQVKRLAKCINSGEEMILRKPRDRRPGRVEA